MPFHRFETTLGHLRGEDLQWSRIGEATGQGLGQQTRIDPGTFGQGHHLGNHQGIAGDDHLVAGLGHLARAHRAHMRDPLPHGQQHRAHPLDIRGGTASHDRQAAGLGALGTAGYRSVDPTHARIAGQGGGHLPGRRRLQARQVQQQLARPGAFGDPAGAEDHLAHHLGIGQARQHQVGLVAELRWRGNLSRPGGYQWRALARVAVPYHQRIASRRWHIGSPIRPIPAKPSVGNADIILPSFD